MKRLYAQLGTHGNGLFKETSVCKLSKIQKGYTNKDVN